MALKLNSTKTRSIYILVMIYLTLAFGWWAYLLIQNYNESFQKEIEILKLDAEAKISEFEYQSSEAYLALVKERNRKTLMIISEGIVFVLTLFFGLYLLNKSYRREIEFRNQQKNFLLSITHELRSPLAGTKLVLETIKKRRLEKTQQDDLVDNALMETDRLNTLVNDMLLAARMEEVYEPVFEITNVKQLFENILSSMHYKHPKIKWQTKTQFSADNVLIDRNGVTSILVNLLENAAKYSGREGEVGIDLKTDNGHIQISVKDHGIGIPDNEKDKVFDRFYRVGNEEVRKSKGTGLGLYLVKQLVDIYKGSISIVDNSPSGTIFNVQLPTQKSL